MKENGIEIFLIFLRQNFQEKVIFRLITIELIEILLKNDQDIEVSELRFIQANGIEVYCFFKCF